MLDNKALSKSLSTAAGKVGDKPWQWGFSPKGDQPVLLIQQKALSAAKFKDEVEALGGEVDGANLWMGTVRKVSGKLLFVVEADRSKGDVRVPRAAAAVKKIGATLGLSKLKTAQWSDAAGEAGLGGTLQAGAGFLDKKGRYRNAVRALATMEASENNDARRVSSMETVAKESQGWLVDHVLGKKQDPKEVVAVADLWRLQRIGLVGSGKAPDKKAMQLGATLFKRELDEISRTFGEEARTLRPAVQGFDKLLSMEADLEYFLADPPKGSADEVKLLTALLADVRELISEQKDLVDSLRTVLETDGDEGEPKPQPWTSAHQLGKLDLPSDATVEPVLDPGVKGKLKSNVVLSKTEALGEDGPAVEKDAHCVYQATDTQGVLYVEVYTREDGKTSLSDTQFGYVAAGRVADHFQKRSWKPCNEPLFPKKPSMDDVVQGGIGDCYLLAAIGSVMKLDPDAITKMVRDNGDGTVTVKLYEAVYDEETGKHDFVEHYLQVDKTIHHKANSSEKERAQGPMWLQMVEKAYAAWGRAHSGKGSEEQSSSMVGVEGGHGDECFRVLLGRESEKTSLTRDKKDWPHRTADLKRSGAFPQEELGLLALSSDDAVLLSTLDSEWSLASGLKALPKDLGGLDAADLDEALRLAGMTGSREIDYGAARTKLEQSLKSARNKAKMTPIDQPMVKASYEADATAIEQMLQNLTLDGKQTLDLDALRRGVVDRALKAGKVPGEAGSGIYTPEQILTAQQFQVALGSGGLVTGGTRKEVKGPIDGRGRSAGEPMTQGLVGGHAYTLLDVTPPLDEREEDGLIWLRWRNPWGDTGRIYEQKDGKLTMRATADAVSVFELTEFLRNFDSYSIA